MSTEPKAPCMQEDLGCQILLCRHGLHREATHSVRPASSRVGVTGPLRMRMCANTKSRPWLCVVAVGADGQGNMAKLSAVLEDAALSYRFMGSFPINVLLPHDQRFASHLPQARTPNIILNAHHSSAEVVEVPRGCHPQVPRRWLTTALNFNVPRGGDMTSRCAERRL